VRGRPRHPVDGGDLGHRAGRIPDRRTDLGAQPPGSPRQGRDQFDGLGEGTALVVSRHRHRDLFHRTMIRFSP
jgi:hypothetical protein